MEVQVALDRRQVDGAVLPHVVGLVLPHDLAGPLDDASEPGLADEHVVRFLGEHEAARAGQRIEAALGEARQLVLAVAVGEEGEHEERQPVGRPLVEGAEDARLVAVARAPLEERLRLFAAVPPEVRVEQVDHRPEVPALLHVDLEEVAEVVERRARPPELALLLDRGGLGVALGDDEPAERAAVLAGHVLPRRLAPVGAEADRPAGLGLGQEDPPAVLGHLHVVEVGPALRVDADRRAEVDVVGLEALGPHVVPPLEEPRLPLLQRPQQAPVLVEADVVGDALLVVDGHHTLLRSNSGRWPVP